MLQEKLKELTQERAGLEQTRAQLTNDLNRVNISIERVRGAEILAKELIAEAKKPATDDDQGDEESEKGNRKGRRVIKT